MLTQFVFHTRRVDFSVHQCEFGVGRKSNPSSCGLNNLIDVREKVFVLRYYIHGVMGFVTPLSIRKR